MLNKYHHFFYIKKSIHKLFLKYFILYCNLNKILILLLLKVRIHEFLIVQKFLKISSQFHFLYLKNDLCIILLMLVSRINNLEIYLLILIIYY